MYTLETKDIIKDFQGHRALNSVSLNVPKGSIYGLLGPNGAGKTTLIRIINQITAADSGTVLFDGRPMKQRDVMRIGYLPEERGLYKKMKVGEQAMYLSQLKGVPARDAQKKLKEWFDMFDMTTWWNKKVEELSKGMQQKVQFIITVLHDPDLLIFDEPFSGFDPINVQLLKNEILNFRKKGTTIIFSTHNMGSVEELCDHITLINKSESIIEGQIDEVRGRYKSNIISVGFEGDPSKLKSGLNGRFELLSVKEEGPMHNARIRINDQLKSNELLKTLLPVVEVHAYNEVIPSMNDIFIQAVQNDTGKK